MEILFYTLRFLSYSMIFHILISSLGPIFIGGATTFIFWSLNGFKNATNGKSIGYYYFVEFFLECVAYSIGLIWLVNNMTIESGVNALVIKICSILAFFSIVNMPEENFRTQINKAILNSANNFYLTHRKERLIIGLIVIILQIILIFSDIQIDLGVVDFFTKGNLELNGWLILHFFSALTLLQFALRSFFKKPNF